MTRVRTIDVEVSADSYPAIERTLIDAVSQGIAEPTIMQWTFDSDLFLEIGPVEDATLIDTERAREHGVSYGRRYNVSGGTGFFRGNHTPVVYAFFPDTGDRTMAEYIDLAGEAMAEALRDAGVEKAMYREGGDVEMAADDGDQLLKIGVSGAGYQDGVWGVFTNLIYESYGPDEFEIIDDVLKLPKEKFEDKDTDSAAGRMSSVKEVAPELDLSTVLAEATENLAALVGGQPETGEFTEAELEQIESHKEYYGSDEWFEHYSTETLLKSAESGDKVAEVAYKGRKLIKTSVRADDDGVISDVQFTGDMFHRPGFTAIERINEAVMGKKITNGNSLQQAISTVFDKETVEIPWLSAEDFVKPLIRARENLVPADSFDRT